MQVRIEDKETLISSVASEDTSRVKIKMPNGFTLFISDSKGFPKISCANEDGDIVIRSQGNSKFTIIDLGRIQE